MNLLEKKKVEHTELYYLERVRPIGPEDVDFESKTHLISADYKSKIDALGRINVSVTMTKTIATEVLDALHPVVDGALSGIRGSNLFDDYFRNREECIENPKKIFDSYNEPTTIHLKRSKSTKEAEAKRVNKKLTDNQDEIRVGLYQDCVNRLTERLDAAIDRHNETVKQTLIDYVLHDTIDEEWAVKNLYTEEQAARHARFVADMEELDAKMKKFRERYRQLKQAKNDARRFILQLHFIQWTSEIPELQKVVQEIDLGKAIEAPDFFIR